MATLRYILTTNQTNHVIGVYDTEAKALAALDSIIRELIRDGYTYQRWTDKAQRNIQRVRAYRTNNKSPVLQYQLYIHKEG